VVYLDRYAGGTVATGRVSHAGQVKGDDADKNGHSDSPGWRLGLELRTPTRKKP
jgi:hypothetical protein